MEIFRSTLSNLQSFVPSTVHSLSVHPSTMARHGIVAILAAAAFGVGVNAGPCKPYSSVGLSSSIIETAASTIPTGVTDTTDVLGSTVTETSQATDSTEVLDTTVTETATGSTEATISIQPTITTEAATTLATTTLATTTAEVTTTEATTAEATTITAETTTTTAEAPPVCEPTQILVNPSFDDNNDASPWDLGAGVTVSQVNPRSAPNFLQVISNHLLSSND